MQTKHDESRSQRAALVLIAFCVIWATTLSVSAAETETFGISPHPEFKQAVRRSFRFGLSPGSSARDSVRIYNKTDRRLRLVVHASDASRSADGTINIPPTGSPPTSVGNWIKLEATEVTLAARQERILSFTVTRPAASQGGGLAAILAEEADSAARPGESVEIVTRIALVVSVGEVSEADLNVGSVAVRSVISFIPRMAEVSASLSNQTDRPITVSVTAEVRSLTGLRYKLESQSIELKAQQTRKVTMPWDTVPRFGGLMRATVRGVHPEGEVSSSSSLKPIVPIWLLLLLILAESWVLSRKLKRRD